MTRKCRETIRTFIALLLCSALIAQILPVPVRAEKAEPAEYEQVQEAQPDAVAEDVSQRTRDSKRFRMEDGSYTVVQYDTPVHYQDEEGQWQEIDNRLQPYQANSLSTEGISRGYRNQASDILVEFAQSLSEGTIYQYGNSSYRVTLGLLPVNGVVQPEAADSSAGKSSLEDSVQEESSAAEANSSAPAEESIQEEMSVPAEESPNIDQSSENVSQEESAAEESKVPEASSMEESTAGEESAQPEESISDQEITESIAEESLQPENAADSQEEGKTVLAAIFEEDTVVLLEVDEKQESMPEESGKAEESAMSANESGQETQPEPGESSVEEVPANSSAPAESSEVEAAPGQSSETEAEPVPAESQSQESQGEASLTENSRQEEPLPEKAPAEESKVEQAKVYPAATAVVLRDTQLMSETQYASKLEELYTVSQAKSGIEYQDVYNGVDLRYEVYGTSVKESIIVSQRSETYIYKFLLTLDGLLPRLEEDGSISLYDPELGEGEDAVQFEIPTPYMKDSSGIGGSPNVRYELGEVDEKGQVVLTVIADPEWINNEVRVMPVLIDPAIVEKNPDYTWDTYVIEGHPTVENYASDSLYAGWSGYDNYGRMRIFWEFEPLPQLPPAVWSPTVRFF